MTTTAPVDEVYRVIHTDHHDPFQILGMHPVTVKGKAGLAIRAFLPDSEQVFLVPEPDAKHTGEVELERVHELGFFETVLPGRTKTFLVQWSMRAMAMCALTRSEKETATGGGQPS